MSEHGDPFETTARLERLRRIQLIAAAMCAGLVIYVGVVVCLVMTGVMRPRPAPANQAGELPLVTIIALAMLPVLAALSFIVPRLSTRQALQQLAAASPSKETSAWDALLPLYQNQLIVALACLEGVGVVGCAAYMIEENVLGLVVAGIVLALMLLRLPTRQKALAWMQTQADRLAQMRQEQRPGC
jgi:hypothetical protein